jgi:hypothetical protein
MTNVDTVQDTGRSAADGGPTEGHDPVPAVVDWLLGILFGVIGLLLTAVGTGIFAWVDQSLIAEFVAEEDVQVNGLTQSEFVTASGPFLDWLAVGIVLSGLVFVVGAVAFLVSRRRTRRRVTQEGGSTATFWACAVYGAVTTVLVSFIPGSAILGGGTAAYIYDGDSSVRAGAAAGLIGAILTIPFMAFLAVGLLDGAGAIGASAGGALLVAFVVGAQLLAMVLNVSFGALGGYLADRVL